MATTTPNLGLRKPATTDSPDVTADISDNMQLIDDAVGYPLFPASRYGVAVANTAAANKTAIDNAMADAQASGGGIVVLPPAPDATAPLLTNGGHDVPGLVEVWGAGARSATCVLNRGSTYAFRLSNETSGQELPGLRRMQILGADGSHAAVNGGIGVEVGNGLTPVIEDLFVGGFTGTGSIGLYYHNLNSGGSAEYLEHSDIRKLFITNCTKAIRFKAESGADTSFGYQRISALAIQLYANQIGIEMDTGTLYNSRIDGEMHFVGDNAVGIKVTATGEITTGVQLDMRGEYDSGTGQKRIVNAGKFWPYGRFTLNGFQMPDDYSAAIQHSFMEEDLNFLDLDPSARVVASAYVMPVPGGSPIWEVSGSTDIHVFDPNTMWEGRVVTLIFQAGCTVVHLASVMNLAGAVNFVAVAGNRLTLVYHGSKAYEVSRSL